MTKSQGQKYKPLQNALMYSLEQVRENRLRVNRVIRVIRVIRVKVEKGNTHYIKLIAKSNTMKDPTKVIIQVL